MPPHPSTSPPPQQLGHYGGNNYHEMPAAPVSDAQYQSQLQPSPRGGGGSELDGSDTPTLHGNQQSGGAQPAGGIMNFIKQNTGGK